MTEQEEELQAKRELFAGIALPGLIMRAQGKLYPEELAEKAFEIAEVMVQESEKWLTPKDEIL